MPFVLARYSIASSTNLVAVSVVVLKESAIVLINNSLFGKAPSIIASDLLIEKL